MNQKEKWIEDQLNADQFIDQVPPSDELMRKLRAIPSQVKSSYDKVPKKVVWAVAASVAVLICINVSSVQRYHEKSESTSTAQSNDSYFSYLNQL